MESSEPEKYPNPPIEFVACEVQYPVSPALAADEALPVLHRALFSWLPLVEPEVQTTLVVGSPQPPLLSKQLRFLSRDRHLGVVVNQNRVSIETTEYPGWAQFRNLVSEALEAVAQAGPQIPGLSRVGLRYIDEIRVPEPAPGHAESRWSRYIDSRLSGPANVLLEGRSPTDVQGVLQFDLGDRYRAVVRYGARRGQAVGGMPLRRRHADQPSGDFFLFDVDCFWTTDETLPEFSVQAALSIADRLHQPVRALFESSITEDLRNDVLRRTPSDG